MKAKIQAFLSIQGINLIKAIESTTAPLSIADDVNQYITEADLMEIYVQMYQDEGVYFYTATQDSLRNKSAYYFNKKAQIPENDPYWTQMQFYVENEIASRITSVTHTSRDIAVKAINTAINEALEKGLSIPETVKLMSTTVDASWTNMMTYRPALIARTEILTASNYASWSGAMSFGLMVNKVWLSFLDSRTRESHISANGQSVGLREHFIVGGSRMLHPGDPAASADETANCRCTIIYEEIPLGG